MNITKLTNVQLINTFFTNVIDITNNDNDIKRNNIKREFNAFTTCNTKHMIDCITEEPWIFDLNEDIDLLIVTTTNDELLFTIKGTKLDF